MDKSIILKLAMITMNPNATREENKMVQKFVLTAAQEDVAIFDELTDKLMDEQLMNEKEMKASNKL